MVVAPDGVVVGELPGMELATVDVEAPVVDDVPVTTVVRGTESTVVGLDDGTGNWSVAGTDRRGTVVAGDREMMMLSLGPRAFCI